MQGLGPSGEGCGSGGRGGRAELERIFSFVLVQYIHIPFVFPCSSFAFLRRIWGKGEKGAQLRRPGTAGGCRTGTGFGKACKVTAIALAIRATGSRINIKTHRPGVIAQLDDGPARRVVTTHSELSCVVAVLCVVLSTSCCKATQPAHGWAIHMRPRHMLEA